MNLRADKPFAALDIGVATLTFLAIAFATVVTVYELRDHPPGPGNDWGSPDVTFDGFIVATPWAFVLVFALIGSHVARARWPHQFPAMGIALAAIGSGVIAVLVGAALNGPLRAPLKAFQVARWNRLLTHALTLEHWSARPTHDGTLEVSARIVAQVDGRVRFRVVGGCPHNATEDSAELMKGQRATLVSRSSCNDAVRRMTLSFRIGDRNEGVDFTEGATPSGDGHRVTLPLPDAEQE